MPAVASQPPNQQSAFSFYSAQKKKKLSVSMKKKNKKNNGPVNLSRAVQSMSSQNASALVLQAKTPILAMPDLTKQNVRGKVIKSQRNKKKNKSKLTNSSIQESDRKAESIERKIMNDDHESGVRMQVASASRNVKKVMDNFETCMTDFKSSFKKGKVSAGKQSDELCSSMSGEKACKKGKAPPVPVSVAKQRSSNKLESEERETSKEAIKIKGFKKANKSHKVSLGKLLQEMDYSTDTKKCGLALLSYLLAPHDPKTFFKSYWESKPLLIQRQTPSYFNGLFSTKAFDSILREQYVEYTKNLDVTSYSEGKRQTHNPSGRVYPSVVWDYFNNGCSLRMLNPQTFHEPVWLVLAALQEYIGSFCGANMYLTPAGTQGFAPHWDDIEAFILQLEGKKRWRVYKPRNVQEVLPRYSSPNLTQEEIGSPIIDVVLKPGDILYFPRGFIHQAEAVEETHSLHITISMYQKNAWVDLFEKVFSPSSLDEIAAKNVAIRKGLPLGCLDYMGSTAASVASGSKKTKNTEIVEQRKKFREQVTSLVSSILTDEVIDSAMDEMGRQLVRVALPPCLPQDDQDCTVRLDGERWEAGKIQGRVEVDPETRIKLLGAMTVRCVRGGGDEYRVYHSVENSREYEGREEQFVVVETRHLPAVQHLVLSYPEYTAVEDLPLPTLEDKLTVAMSLWEQHLVMTEHPLIPLDEHSGSDSEC